MIIKQNIIILNYPSNTFISLNKADFPAPASIRSFVVSLLYIGGTVHEMHWCFAIFNVPFKYIVTPRGIGGFWGGGACLKACL